MSMIESLYWNRHWHYRGVKAPLPRQLRVRRGRWKWKRIHSSFTFTSSPLSLRVLQDGSSELSSPETLIDGVSELLLCEILFFGVSLRSNPDLWRTVPFFGDFLKGCTSPPFSSSFSCASWRLPSIRIPGGLIISSESENVTPIPVVREGGVDRGGEEGESLTPFVEEDEEVGKAEMEWRGRRNSVKSWPSLVALT